MGPGSLLRSRRTPRRIVSIVSAGMLCLPPAVARAAGEVEGEIGAALSVGIERDSVLVGGDARTGMYLTRRRTVPMLVGNRVGFDVRLRPSYGRRGDGAMLGNVLVGMAPSFTHQFGGTGRYLTGWRLTSLTGLALPEPGVWFRTDGPALFYLGWRAQVTWLPDSEAGLELVPSFVWAPSGAWMGTLSLGGFLR